jgi:exopolyphosphatase/guanosine-5'-triphosphate,3'-diphosphate pyrophosphatase
VNRFAAIDVGTNTVLLLVAERRGDGFAPLVERAEITRLGRGVDRTGRLDTGAIRETVEVLARYANEARGLGAAIVACVATSAARDARNSAEFFDAARTAAGLVPEVIAGEEEARLVYRSAWRDFGAPGSRLAVLDVGGGSTEFTWGDGPAPLGRRSLQVGAVRLTERVVDSDPVGKAGLERLRASAGDALRELRGLDAAGNEPPPYETGFVGAGARLVAVAGTVTTLAAVWQALPVYDAERVHGSQLSLPELEALFDRLGALTVAERARLPGMEPKRADVIVAGCAIVIEALRATGFRRLTVSDRGVRWGLLYDRLGA